VLSDKLFYWLFQSRPDRILSLVDALPADAGGYRFSAPALKEREYRLDGLFLPPSQRPDLPALILEAQMGEDPGFLRRLYAESARLLQQQPSIHAWQVVVITPSRLLNFGATEPVAEFLSCRVQWVELLPERWGAVAGEFQRLLALLVRPEAEIQEAVRELGEGIPGAAPAELSSPADSSTADSAELLTLIPTILLARFNDRPLQEICAMAGLTVDDFTQSVAYREIFGQGRQEGRQIGRQEGRKEGEAEGRRVEAASMTLRQLNHRCGPLTSAITARIQALPLEQLEALGLALLDFSAAADLAAWLDANT
jgi:predicted transposase YdaD